jgi:hypothetical protein
MTHHTVLARKNNIIAIACLKPVILNDITLGTKLASGNSRSPYSTLYVTLILNGMLCSPSARPYLLVRMPFSVPKVINSPCLHLHNLEQRFPNCGSRPAAAVVGLLGGDASCLYEGNMGAR